jgi:hypothetical protein
MTVKLRRYEPSIKSNIDLPKLLMILWKLHHQRGPLRSSIQLRRPFISEPYGARGHWVLNARNALDSGRTGE